MQRVTLGSSSTWTIGQVQNDTFGVYTSHNQVPVHFRLVHRRVSNDWAILTLERDQMAGTGAPSVWIPWILAIPVQVWTHALGRINLPNPVLHTQFFFWLNGVQLGRGFFMFHGTLMKVCFNYTCDFQ